MANLGFTFDPSVTRALSNYELAVSLHEHGLHVFPCQHEGDNAKQPCPGVMWRRKATRAIIDQQWQRWPDAMPGLNLGESGLLVVDADGTAGISAWEAIAAEYGGCDAPTVDTPGNGRHYYFRQPDGMALGNARGALPKKDVCPVDIRGAGGYVIAPGAEREDGIYEPGDGDPLAILDAPIMPPWLVDLLTKQPEKEAPKLSTPITPSVNAEHPRLWAYVEQTFKDEIRGLATCGKGGRNNQLNTAGFSLFQLAAAKWSGISASEVEAALFQAAEDCGLVADDGATSVRKTIRSARRGGMASPRPLPEHIAEEIEQDARAFELGSRSAAAIVRQPDGALIDQDTGEVLVSRGTLVDLSGPIKHVPPDEIVRDTIPARGVGFMGGQSGAYKTFTALDMLFCIATGEPFAGRAIERRGGGLYVAAEGQGTIRDRIIARRTRLPYPEADIPILMLANFGQIISNADYAAFEVEIRRAQATFWERFGFGIGVVVIDTVAAAGMIPEDKENDPAAWSRIFNFLGPISEAINAPIVLIHHYGKSAEAGLRGSSNARAGADFVLALTCDRDEQTGDHSNHALALTKSRTAPEGSIAAVRAVPVEIGRRMDGSPVTSLVLEFDTGTKVVSGSRRKPSKAVRAFQKAFHNAITKHFEEVRVHGELDAPIVKAVRSDWVREEFGKVYATPGDDDKKRQDTLRKQFKNGLENLPGIQSGHWEGMDWIWRNGTE